MDTRTKIVETASRLFYTNGFNNTGINQVIKEAKIAKASLYQYFPSKEDLLLEYLKINGEATNAMLKSIAATYPTAREKVERIFDFLVQFSEASNCNGCHFLNITAELPNGNDKVKALVKWQKDQVRELFREILGPEVSGDLADELYLLFDGALVTSKIQSKSWPILVAKKIALKLI